MIVNPNQSILDISLQASGGIETLFDTAAANGVGITDDLLAGQVVDIPGTSNDKVVGYYSVNGIIPATAPTAYELEQHPVGGINYMGIEIDFIVS